MDGLDSGSVWTPLADQYHRDGLNRLARYVDRMFAWLLAAEWVGMIVTALVLSPRLWNGAESVIHPHVWAAVIAGPAFIFPAIAAAWLLPSHQLTRHFIAVAQMLVSILLIDITGGRIETHFHIFGSLAFLAFYRDWRVLVTASTITAVDHVLSGIWWPQAVYGVLAVSPWRWVEHAWWVVFEDFFLFTSIRRSIGEMRIVSMNKAHLYMGANHDVLTGLANRRLLQQTFDKRPVAATGERRGLLFIDLDRFKHANDTLGHTVGDALLQQVATRLSGAINPGDILARIGGDEFVVLMENLSGETEATASATRILTALVAPFQVEKHELLLSASVGIGFSPDHGVDLFTLQQRADQAMYVAKSRGRNQYAIYSADVARDEVRLQELERDLHKAQANDQFRLHFQPLVDRTGGLTGFEALLRWIHPVYGTVSPGDFIPLAERSGLMVPIGEWVLREACRHCISWQHPGRPQLHVAVNVSPIQFEQYQFQSQVASILGELNMDPGLLTLELTESTLLGDVARACKQLSSFRDLGIRISLDDFGTGYASLSYLTALPADTIKLDRTFVNRDMPNATAVLASVIGMAHGIGLRVVGEGVETLAQSDRLAAMACDEMQGFYFSRPMPGEDVEDYLSAVLAREESVTETVEPVLVSL